MKVCRREDKPFTFFLFSNMLMYGVRVIVNLKEKYKISHQFPINGNTATLLLAPSPAVG